jgi:uncharacterized protein YecE (DUF72 family)
LRKDATSVFPPGASHLARYAGRFNAVEINSSFYRPHRLATYERWAAATPDDFAFAVKAPKTITHTLRLQNCAAPLSNFLGEISGLGDKLGPVLFQLPPNLAFTEHEAATFFTLLRDSFHGGAVCEPRHASWCTPAADKLLQTFSIARAAADPAVVPAAASPGGDERLRYYRLHGSPRMYYTAYGEQRLQAIAADLRAGQAAGARTWCVFDNTAAGAAMNDGIELQRLVGGGG